METDRNSAEKRDASRSGEQKEAGAAEVSSRDCAEKAEEKAAAKEKAEKSAERSGGAESREKGAAPEEKGAAAAAAAAGILEEEEEKEAAQKAAAGGKKDPKDVRIAELEDKLKRSLAEFENFRKRTEREKSQMFDLGARSVLEKILPTIDNFERSLASAPDTEEAKSYVEGMQMVYKQLLKNLEDAGVTAMDAKGKPFDPNFHNAVMHVEDDSLGENVVAEELQNGYLYKDAVLRHSMVKVAN